MVLLIVTAALCVYKRIKQKKTTEKKMDAAPQAAASEEELNILVKPQDG